MTELAFQELWMSLFAWWSLFWITYWFCWDAEREDPGLLHEECQAGKHPRGTG